MSKVRVIFEFNHVMHEVKPAGNDSQEITEGVTDRQAHVMFMRKFLNITAPQLFSF